LVAKAEHGYRFGDPVAVLPGTLVTADGKCLVDVGGGKSVFAQLVPAEGVAAFMDSAVVDEARVLPIRRSTAGERARTWASIADDSHVEEFKDWPIAGPRSVSWCLAFLKQEGRNIELHHERFKALAKVDYSAWGMVEHKEISGFLQHLCGYDQLDPANLACAEAMFRRLQTIEFSYLEKIRDAESKAASGGRLTLEEQAIFGGLTRSDAALMIAPSLLDHARSEAERSASLAKNLRKAREEREAARKK